LNSPSPPFLLSHSLIISNNHTLLLFRNSRGFEGSFARSRPPPSPHPVSTLPFLELLHVVLPVARCAPLRDVSKVPPLHHRLSFVVLVPRVSAFPFEERTRHARHFVLVPRRPQQFRRPRLPFLFLWIRTPPATYLAFPLTSPISGRMISTPSELGRDWRGSLP